MAMSEEQEKQLEELFKEKLKEQYLKGIKVGVLSASKVIIDKLEDKSKPLTQRVSEVKQFCKVPWEKENLALTETRVDELVPNTDTEEVTENSEKNDEI